MKVYEALEHIKKNGPYLDAGICHNFHDRILDMNREEYRYLYDKWETLHKKAFKEWKNFSGDVHYPIEGNMMEYASARYVRWNKESRYGTLRWELLDHLIAWFKEKDI